jgi:OOP family OmpA-OmpF porin
MKALLASLAVVALFAGGCPSAYQKTYDEETARLEAQQRLRDQQEAARREADRQEARKYVAIALFAVGSDVLDDTAFRELDWFLGKIAPYPHVEIEVKGYTDATGSESTNQPLSNKRAWNVQDYLVSRGIAANRIFASGFGASDPARPNVTPDGRVQNRRAEVRVR